MDEGEIDEAAARSAKPSPETALPIDEDWVYDLDGKPWGVAEVDRKQLSLRRDAGGGITRRFIRPKVVPGGESGATTVEFALHHQRRTNTSVPYEPLNLGTLKGGDWVRIELNSDETLMLYKHLENLYAIGDEGVVRGARRLRVVDADEVTVSGELGEIIGKLRAENSDDELRATLEALMPDLVDAVALKRERQSRLAAIAEFEAHMPGGPGGPWTEPEWKRYFERNDWIFGHNLDYQLLVEQEPEAYVGGRRLGGGGSQIADHVRSTPGDWSFAVLVEIKRPDTQLLRGHYREGTYRIHPDLSDGVAQAQANCQALVRLSATAEGAEELAARNMAVADPQGILVIGTTAQLTDRPRQETFHRFRRNLWNPTVITFDELLARAKFQVSRMAPSPAEPGPPSARPGWGRPPAFSAPVAVTPSTVQWDEPEPDGPGGEDDDPDWEPDPDFYRDDPAES